MPVTKTIEFLPEVFQTETNQKFLNATMDQLVAEPKLNRVNGYIGRKFAPTYKSGDSYVQEKNSYRTNYQLEPSVSVKNTLNGDIDFHVTYPELLQKLNYYGVNVANQNSLWQSEYYTYNPHVDWDKFIDFSQYYWLPNGPDAIDVFAGSVDLEKTYEVTANTSESVFNFSGYYNTPNPDIVLARGGEYKFEVNRPGHKFWIQSAPGLGGKQSVLTNVSSRDVYGVTNNGAETGTVTFVVPNKTAQDFYINMPKLQDVDFVTTLKYSDLQNKLLSSFADEFGGVDGQTTPTMLNAKYIIFGQQYFDDADWTSAGRYAAFPYDEDIHSYDDGYLVPPDHRYGIWQIELVVTDTNDYLITLQYIQGIPVNTKVTVKTGVAYGGTEWYQNAELYNQQMPAITANLDTLYYQDGSESSYVGAIRLVEPSANNIDVDTEIIGKQQYVSPNGVVFTNGMKIVFDESVTPVSYQNKEYYVEGVGTNITLTLVESLGGEYDTPDYMVINRSSLEKSQWTCGNRWFHKEVIRLTGFYNNNVPVYDQNLQARRPIVEFEPNLQLFDFGYKAKIPVDVFDTRTVTPFISVEGKRINSVTSSGVYLDGVELTEGMRVIFALDQDPSTRNNVWVVTFIRVGPLPTDPYQIHLVIADDGEVSTGDTVLVKTGLENKNKNFWYYDLAWNEGQEKTSVNQPPRFDVFAQDGNSFGDQALYPVVSTTTAFQGTKIFGYTEGNGPVDPVLGIALEYRNVNNIGDISFTNNFDTDSFQYAIDKINYSTKVNTGLLKKNHADGSVTFENNWIKVEHPTNQYQILNYVYDGKTNAFYVDVTPRAEDKSPSLLVYVDNVQVIKQKYIVENVSNGIRIYIDSALLKLNSKIDILVNSNTVSTLAYYQVPVNLDNNTQNISLTNMTLGELRNHIKSLVTSTNKFTGNYPGNNNLRDLCITNGNGSIVQHSSGIPYAAMFLVDSKLNLVDSIELASREYTRFKNKFLEISTSRADISAMDASNAVDEILKQVNAIKNMTFPWFYSDMVPYGDEKNTITYSIFNPAVRGYEITTIFDALAPSNKAVLVYYNGMQLIHGIDYTFASSTASINIDDSFTMEVGATLTIVEYNNTNGSYIPETPSKLGLYPKYSPTIFVDSTYLTPVTMIRGHDGSCTPAFGDFRDQLLLELEKRIFNNIKVQYDEVHFGVHNVVPGRFRDTKISLTDYSRILNRGFMQWVGFNRLDFITNDTWVRDNSFTWNYRAFGDSIDGSPLPGSWRACYQYYFDTQTPHLTPWEMLGFSEKPTWWDTQYGPAPYTGGNLVLWRDLENGYIAQGARQGTDQRYVRPGLTNIIPVDVNGNLLPPAGCMVDQYEAENSAKAWSSGNIGPVENAWRNSSEYPFSVQTAMALTKPASYFGLNINKQLLAYDNNIDQFINKVTRQRMTQDDIVINGETSAAGYINWIADRLRSIGISPDVLLKRYISEFDIRLTYRMAAFSDKKYLKVLAEQYSPNSNNDSVLIPDSDYDLILNKSAPVQKMTYSAVIVEKTTVGFKVSGYDTANPTFTVIPPETTSATHPVTVLNQSVDVYEKYKKFKLVIPYGYEFTTAQQVTNFLMGYGLYLTSQGFRFDEYDTTLQEVKNWVLSVKEFLFWSQQGWTNQSLLVLSPVGSAIKAVLGSAVADAVSSSMTGSRVLNQNFQPLTAGSLKILRDRNQFKCSTTNEDMIAFIELDMVQYEHALIFNNTTMFNDVIYRPELGLRQSRLKLVGFKTSEWTGNLDPKGFIYNNDKFDQWQPMRDYLKGDIIAFKGIVYSASRDLAGAPEFNYADWIRSSSNYNTGLLPNLTFNSSISESFYDTESVNLESQYDQFGKSIIGFKNRGYLDMLGVDDTTQVKFYQGFIRDKGTPNSFNALANAKFGNIDSSVEVNEEWAFRVGEYGALEISQTVDLELSDQNILSNPFSVQMTNSDPTADVVITNPYLSSELDFAPPLFLNRNSNAPRLGDIQTAGFVNIEDIDLTVFDINNINDLDSIIDQIGSGTKVWCAKDFDSNWNVYRVTETRLVVTRINNALDGLITITTDNPHGLTVGDVVVVKSVDQFTGIYRVQALPSISKFTVQTNLDLTGFTSRVDLQGNVYTLQSMKYNYAFEIASYLPADGWKDTDVAWVLNNDQGNWGVYKKETPWSFNDMLPVGEIITKSRFGTAVNLSHDNNFALIGKPNVGSGILSVYAKSFSNQLQEQDSLSPSTINTSGFGATIEQGTQWAVVGAPDSNSERGYAFTVYRTNTGRSSIRQVLVAPDSSAGDRFGESVTISTDDQWVYVGAPGGDAVYTYGFVNNVVEHTSAFESDGSQTSFVLNFVPDSTDAISVATETRTYVPYIDYTVTGAVITFTTAPGADLVIVRQLPGFRYVSKITGQAGSNFGFSVSSATDGAQVTIGAPFETVSGLTTAGAVYVYDRTIEAFTAGTDTAYAPVRPFGVTGKVKVNDLLQGRRYTADKTWTYEINSLGQVQFTTLPPVGSLVTIETNQFNLLERITADIPQSGAQLGYSNNLCPTNCSLYAGAPTYNDGKFNSGALYRFFNQGRTLGYIVGSVSNPVVVSGSSIRLNDYEVTFLETTLDSVVAAINDTRIPGVVASNSNGYLRIDSDIKISRDRLRVLTGVGNALRDLGLQVFPQVQLINNPYPDTNEYFGRKVRVTRTLPDTTLLIGSSKASSFETTTFDGEGTHFDANSTVSRDKLIGSGAVFVYTYLNDARETASFPAGLLAFVQQLIPTNGVLSSGDEYGYDFDIQDDTVLIGAPNESSALPESGQVFVFSNPNRYLGWNLIRSEEPAVDIDSVNQFYLWSKANNTIISTLDYIDPVKGKLLGTAEQEIKYKTVYDPASYNNGFNPAVDFDVERHWSDQQVGEVWWDLDKIRYIDYEQGPLSYRSTNWGKMFPGSSVDVYEWVESSYLPSEYIVNGGNGTPKHPDDSAYVAITVVDSLTNQEYNKYYFWVKDKTTVNPNQFGRSIPVLSVKHLIENPKGQNVMYVAAIKDDAMALFNCGSKVVGTDTVLHVDYDRQINSSIVHSEWELVKESAASGFADVPDRIFNKLIDSLAGIDSFGNTVPDPLLPVQQSYGIQVRPRQSMFIDRGAAMKVLVETMNAWFKTIPLSLAFNISDLASKEEIPPANSGKWDIKVPNLETLGYINVIIQPVGYTVLVESDETVSGLWTIYTKTENNTWFLSRVQTFNDEPYWDYVDWYADGYTPSLVPKYTVATNADLAALDLRENDIVKIRNDGSGNFRVIKVSQIETKTIALQNGTIKLNSNLYDLPAFGMGFGNDNFGVGRFDQNPFIETRTLLDTLINTVLGSQYKSQYGKVLQLIFNYVLTEQKYVDWMFKTSFISVQQKLRKLNQPAVYTRDNQDFYAEYINEVKPYHTTLREYVVAYEGVDNYNGYVTDFDVPAYYDSVLGMYRSPSGEYYQDTTALQNPVYNDWVQTYTYTIPTGVNSIKVVPTRPGKGYLTPPVITVTGSAVGNDAKAVAVFDYSTGSITAINVTRAGTGYIGRDKDNLATPPTVTISGGSLPYNAVMFVRGNVANVGSYIKTPDLRYFSVTTGGTLGYIPAYNADQAVGDLIQTGDVTLAYLGEEALAYIVLQNSTIRKIKTVLTFDRITFTTSVKVWQPLTRYFMDDIVTFNNITYRVISEYVSGENFDGNNLELYTESFSNANDRIQAYYDPTVGLVGKSLDLLQSGIDYPGVKVTGPRFSDNPFFDSGSPFDSIPFDSFEFGADGIVELSRSLLDTIVTSGFTDSFLTPTEDTRPEGIVIDGGGDIVNGNIAINPYKPTTFTGGGGFVDTNNSHAPEELIPGRVFDTLDLQVYQSISPNISTGSGTVGMNIQFISHRVTAPFETYSYSHGDQFNDKLFVYSNLTGKLDESSDYTINYIDQTITMVKALVDGDAIFIYSFNEVGADEKTEMAYVGDGETTSYSLQYSSGVPLTVFAMIDGIKTTEFTVLDQGPRQEIKFGTAPADGSYIHIITFGYSADQPYSEIHTQEHIVSRPGTSITDYAFALDRVIGKTAPFESYVIVELDKTRLRPPSNAYHLGDGVNKAFQLPSTALDIDIGTVTDSDVKVYVDGVTLGSTMYTKSGAIVILNTAPTSGVSVVVSVTSKAEYKISDSGTEITITNTVMSQGGKITVTSFANHELLGMTTRTFVGGQTYVSNLPVGLDKTGFDSTTFDGDETSKLVIPKFNLDSVIFNSSYLWITLDGRRLIPNYDFIIDGQYLFIAPKFNLTDENVIVVTEFEYNPAIGVIAFRIIQDITGKVEYLRIPLSGTTRLAKQIDFGDTEIVVTDASTLPDPGATLGMPGIIMVNGERIVYFAIDRETNTLSQLRRGTGGTGATVHSVGSRVDDVSKQQLIPNSADVYTLAVFKGVNAGDGTNKTFTSSEETTGFAMTLANAESLRVYVGGTLLRNDADVSQYTVNSVSPVSVTLTDAPPAGVWVAFEVRTGGVWYDIGIVDANNPVSSGLANSTTNQALFLKEEPGFLP